MVMLLVQHNHSLLYSKNQVCYLLEKHKLIALFYTFMFRFM